ncbi:MAG: ABC transporter ATP-binding protein/permease [Chloroflexi bacterium]|nr:ABC transporter ATP-binding protein/permease [Chloroflexota bacterium]MCC6893468.1 ABC transporter ATP-binding protein [Anaerolineae bacterium]
MQAQATQGQTRRGRGGAPSSGGRGGLGRAIGYLRNQGYIPLVAYIALLIATLAQLAVPQLTQNMTDAVTNGFIADNVLKIPAIVQPLALGQIGKTLDQVRADQANAQTLLINAGLFIVAFAIARGVFSFLQTYYAELMSQSAAFDMRNEIFAKVQRLSFTYHDQNQTGQLMVRATDDVEKVRLFIAQGLMQAVSSLVLIVLILIILFATNVQLTLVALPTLPVAMVVFMIFGAVAQPLFIAVQQKISSLNTVLQESLAGIKVVKAFVREPYEEGRFTKAADDVLSTTMRVSRTFTFLFPVVFLVAQVGQAGILYFGGRDIIGNNLTLGEYQKFSLYLTFLFLPLAQLGFIISQMAQASASSARIFEILDAKNDVEDKSGAAELKAIEGRVEFKDVTFRYVGGSEPVLKNVSFEAQPGQTVALLGATGSGKTSIINLLPRFYDVTEGQVLIDGQDVRDVTIDSLRSQIGIVLQETNLFGGSIRDNIAFGRSDATLEEVISAAKAAAAHDFIMTFPEGYETPVGERGSTLSGGQKQRIAIARALLLNPRLLILDDSTSSVDLMTEYHIQKALDNLMHGRTSFVIAQRISTVVNADQILVLDKGEIVARGKHEELMEESAIYAEIYHSQLVGDAEATTTDAPTVTEAK